MVEMIDIQELKKNLSLDELLLLYKYSYYIDNYSLISDYEYDILEKEYLKIDPNPEYWVGFNYKHPKANKILKLLNKK